MTSKKASMFVEEAKAALRSAISDAATVTAGVELCNKHIRSLNVQLRREKLSVGAKQHLVTSIASIKSFRSLMKVRQCVNADTEEVDSKRVEWEDMQSAFRNRLRTGVIINLTHKDVAAFLEDAVVLFQQHVEEGFKTEEAFKINAVFCGEFILNKELEEEFAELKYFKTKNAPIFRDTSIKDWFTDHVKGPIMVQLGDFEERDSGWTLRAIVNLMININTFVLLTASSYIELPKQIRDKKACINVKNRDNACFAWAVISALYPVHSKKHPDRPSSYPHYSSVLNLENITMPMTTRQIPRFEQQNSVSINVFFLKEKGDARPFYLTKDKKSKHVNLLLLQDSYKANTVNYHYVWIKDLSRLLSSQLSAHQHKKYFCDRCLNYFYKPERLHEHAKDCGQLNVCKIRMPKTETGSCILKFKNLRYKIKVPFIIYADLECLLKPCSNQNSFQEHVPCSIGFYVKCSYDDSLSFYRSYRGEDCMSKFTTKLRKFAEDLETVFLYHLPMNQLTSAENLEFSQATHCHICNKSFGPNDRKIRDHCHLTGSYRGAAHEDCNINYTDSRVVPVVFHNLSGYDSHFVIKNLASDDFKGRIDLLPVNKERYISFTKHVTKSLKFRFIDSFRFMSSSLEELASNLKSYPILRSEFQNLSEEKFQLLTRKGVYPYDYFDSLERFTESELPAKEKFYNKLNDAEISDDDYAHAECVWRQFGIRNLGEYSDLYLRTDVLLLADVFEKFRSTLHESHGLDPAHYFSAPGYTWDAMLKFTNVKLELLTDVDMHMFIERGIRGGLSQCSMRYAKANNKYMANYDPTQASKYLLYLDVNNLYGYAMSQPLPSGGFKWVEDLENFDFSKSNDDSSIGYILEVDLEYPANIHKAHADLPFCTEHTTAPNSKELKLMATLHRKDRYVIYHRHLHQALEHGLKLAKIHRVLKFNQSVWLKPYIDLNTRLRTAAENDFEKDLYKLLNNAVFGKTMENVRKHSVVKLVQKWEGRYGAGNLIAKPEFKSCTIFNENLIAVELNKTEIFFNKPIYVGMCVLDISKTKLYEFHYDYMREKFDKCKVCYTDTDSLIYEIECDDVYKRIQQDCDERFDTSDYPEDNPYGIPRVNKKVPGFMKDELKGSLMTEFVGLRSKSYSYRVQDQVENKKAKGVKKYIIRNKITFNDYFDCLKNWKEKSLEQNLIRSEKHQVYTVRQLKIALSPYDDKRHLIRNSYETLPWGHTDIMDDT